METTESSTCGTSKNHPPTNSWGGGVKGAARPQHEEEALGHWAGAGRVASCPFRMNRLASPIYKTQQEMSGCWRQCSFSPKPELSAPLKRFPFNWGSQLIKKGSARPPWRCCFAMCRESPLHLGNAQTRQPAPRAWTVIPALCCVFKLFQHLHPRWPAKKSVPHISSG